MPSTIYLDYNTTTPMAGAVRQAMQPFMNELFMLPGNLHWKSRAVEEAIEDARNKTSSALDCLPSEIVFTRSATESVNLALQGYARAIRKKVPGYSPHLITSTIESPTVRQAVDRLERIGWEVTRLSCDNEGRVAVDQIANKIASNTRIISIQWANEDIGTIQDIAAIGKLTRPPECVFHCDAVQALGKVGVSLPTLGIDLMTLSGHHAYAAKGVGVLYVRSGILLKPLLFGQWQEGGLVPGAENVAAIAGLGVAMELIQNAGMELGERMGELTNRFEDRLKEELSMDLVVHGVSCDRSSSKKSKTNRNSESKRLPNTLSIVLPDRDAQQLLLHSPELYLGYSSAYSDHAQRSYPLSTLEAIDVGPREAASTIRVSLGWNTTEEEVDEAVIRLADAYRKTPEMTEFL